MTERELFSAYRNMVPFVVVNRSRCGYPMCPNEAELDGIFCSDCQLALLRRLE